MGQINVYWELIIMVRVFISLIVFYYFLKVTCSCSCIFDNLSSYVVFSLCDLIAYPSSDFFKCCSPYHFWWAIFDRCSHCTFHLWWCVVFWEQYIPEPQISLALFLREMKIIQIIICPKSDKNVKKCYEKNRKIGSLSPTNYISENLLAVTPRLRPMAPQRLKIF